MAGEANDRTTLERRTEISVLWRDILDFERQAQRSPTRMEVALRDRFGVTPARYYQALNRVLDRPEALEYDPMLVRRLRRLREERRRRRFAQRVEVER